LTFLLASIVLLMLFPDTPAQHIRGALEGTVSDPDRALVSGAKVTLRQAGTGAQIENTTDERGRFNFQNVEPGSYILVVQKPGFRQYTVSGLIIKVGGVTAVSVNLEIGNVTAVVEVVSTSGEATVDTSRPVVDGVVSPKQIENLPLNGRNFLDLAQQEPGVQVRDGANIDPTKNQFVGVSIGGRSGISTRIQVDGVDITDETVGTTTNNISN